MQDMRNDRAEEIRDSIQSDVVESLNHSGSHIAVEHNGREHDHKWNNGRTTATILDNHTGEEEEAVFEIRVVRVNI